MPKLLLDKDRIEHGANVSGLSGVLLHLGLECIWVDIYPGDVAEWLDHKEKHFEEFCEKGGNPRRNSNSE